MKKALILALILAAALALAPAAAAAGEQDAREALAESIGTEDVERAVPESAEDILDGASAKSEDGTESGWRKLLAKAAEAAGAAVSDAASGAAALVLTALVCGAAVSLGDGGSDRYVRIAGVLAVAALSAADVRSFLNLAQETLENLSAFSHALLPTLTATAAFSGSAASAAARYSVVVLFNDILLTVSTQAVLPLAGVFLAAAAAAAAFGSDALKGAANLVKWLCVSVLAVVVFAFVTYASAVGAAAGTADAAATRFAKAAISTAVPVAGGAMADAASAVTGGMAALRSSVGLFGMLAVGAVCVLPFLRLAARYLVFKAASVLAQCVAEDGVSGFIGSVASAYGIALGATGAGAIMLFVSIVSMMKAVSG